MDTITVLVILKRLDDLERRIDLIEHRIEGVKIKGVFD